MKKKTGHIRKGEKMLARDGPFARAPPTPGRVPGTAPEVGGEGAAAGQGGAWPPPSLPEGAVRGAERGVWTILPQLFILFSFLYLMNIPPFQQQHESISQRKDNVAAQESKPGHRLYRYSESGFDLSVKTHNLNFLFVTCLICHCH